MYKIFLTETRQAKNPNTKTTYITESVKTEEITEEQYNNYINSISFFRRLGGTETAQRSYTSAGYKVTQLNSKSPDRQTKVLREFRFVWEDQKPANNTLFTNLSLLGKFNSLSERNLITEEAKSKFSEYKYKKGGESEEAFKQLHDLFNSLNK